MEHGTPFGENPTRPNRITSDANNPVVAEKKALRKEIRAQRRNRRDTQTEQDLAQESAGYARQAAALSQLQQAGCVASFEPMRTEPNISQLNSEISQFARIIYPITLENLDLSWRDAQTGEDLGLDGIALADCIIAPGLAVDVRGYRLGQGGGCYDGALGRRRSGVAVIMTAFDSEIVEAVPREPHDRAVDAVLTSTQVRWFEPAPGQAPLA